MAPPTKYLVLGERAAEVDDVRLTPGGEAVALSDNQVERLKNAGVEVETPQERGKRLKADDDTTVSEPAALAAAGGDR